MIDAHQRMVAELAGAGKLPEQWRAAFLAVPRHMFIPEVIWDLSPDREWVAITADSPRWLDAVYSDTSVLTQLDDGGDTALHGHRATSSSSMPSVVSMMLDAAAIAPPMRVLEIGTGTGWNAALLAHRLGEQNVTSVEIDPAVAEHARAALNRAALHPTVITGDGASGYPPHAPYDRIIATAAVHDVPYPWIVQTRPGGRVIIPWSTAYHSGALLRLDVPGDGTAAGRFGGDVSFMWLREQRISPARVTEIVTDPEDSTRVLTEHPHHLLDEWFNNFDASFAIGLQVPHCQAVQQPPQDETTDPYIAWFLDPHTGSWAELTVDPDTEQYPVRQHGPRNLWDEVATACRWWIDNGRPAHSRFGLTVTPDRQWTWLDTPATPVPVAR